MIFFSNQEDTEYIVLKLSRRKQHFWRFNYAVEMAGFKGGGRGMEFIYLVANTF